MKQIPRNPNTEMSQSLSNSPEAVHGASPLREQAQAGGGQAGQEAGATSLRRGPNLKSPFCLCQAYSLSVT